MKDLKIFISHKHDEDAMPKSITEEFENSWGVPGENIFCSSIPFKGVTSGNYILDDVVTAIKKSNLFIQLYTKGAQKSDYCTAEYGVAKCRTDKIKMVCIKLTDDHQIKLDPGVLTTSADEFGIKNLVNDIYRTEGFIPGIIDSDGKPAALLDTATNEMMNDRALSLHRRIYETSLGGNNTDAHCRSFLRAHLSSETLININEVINESKNKELVTDLIRDNLHILRPRFKSMDSSLDGAIKHFGYNDYRDGLKLSELIDRWVEINDGKYDTLWADGIFESIYLILNNRSQKTAQHIFKSVVPATNWWFLPVVTRYREELGHKADFDIYLINVLQTGIFQQSPS